MNLGHEDWFNYVINPDLLDHLLANSAGSEKQLIKYLRHFLDHSRQYDGKEQGSESHQGQLLLAMSAKIFAQLHYSLAKIAHKLPVALAHRLMLWLCASCGTPDPYRPEQQPLSPSARWLYQLYHRWALRCMVHENYVKKPPRSMVQGVAGITDRSMEQHCVQSAEVAAHLKSRVERSLECLLAELQAGDVLQPAAQPGPACFRLPTLAEPECRPDWTLDNRPVTEAEFRSLVHFDLGQYYFMLRRYSQAFDHFTAAAPAASASATPALAAATAADDIDEGPVDEAEIPARQLEAYLTAIRSVSRQADARPQVLQRLELCRARHWDGLSSLLTEELTNAGAGKPQLPDYHWDLLSAEVAASESLGLEVKFQVQTCRLVRRALDNACSVLDYPQLLASRGSAGVQFLVSAAATAAVTPAGTSALRRLLRYLLGHLRPPPEAAYLTDWPGPPGDLLKDDDLTADSSRDEDGDDGEEKDEFDEEHTGLATDGDGDNALEEDEAFYREAELACGQTSDDLRLLVCYHPAEASALVDRLCRSSSWTPASVSALCRAWQPTWPLQHLPQQPQLQQPPPHIYHHSHHHPVHHSRQQQQLLPNHPQAAASVVLAGKANVLQRLGEFELARQLLGACSSSSSSGIAASQQSQQHALLLLDMRRCLTCRARPTPELASAAEAALRQLQEGVHPAGNNSEELAILGSCLMLCAGRLPPQSALGSGNQQQQQQQQHPTASNYCIDFARLLMLAAADREARSAATAAGAAVPAGAGQKAPSHADLWARVGRLFAALGGAKRSAPSGPGASAAAAAATTSSQPHELGFAKRCFRRLLGWLRSEAHLDLMVSLLVKLACLSCTDLNVPVHSACPDLWPDQMPARLLTVVQRASLRRALLELLETALATQPACASWLVTRADLAFAEHQPGLALRCYLEAAIAASELFERPLPIQLFGDDTLRRMVRCCELVGMRSCAGILAQSVPDQASAVRLLTEPGACDLSDSVLPYLWDLSLLEILTAVSARRGALAKRDKFVRAARAMELNSCNRADLLHEVETARRAEFLRALANYVFGSG